MATTYKVNRGLSGEFNLKSEKDIAPILNCLNKTEFRVPISKKSPYTVPAVISIVVAVLGILWALSTPFVQTILSLLLG